MNVFKLFGLVTGLSIFTIVSMTQTVEMGFGI